MPQQFNSIPTYQTPLVNGRVTQSSWYRFWQGIFTGAAPGAESPVTPGASPYTYTAPFRGFLIVQGGTVSLIEFSRGGTTYRNVGVTAGAIPANSQDLIRITYTVAPTLTFVPT